jgi:hypothetical protein
MLVLQGIYLLAALASLGLQITGNVFCMAAPSRHGAKTLARVSVSLLVGGLVLMLVGLAVAVVGTGAGLAAATPGPALAASGAGLVIMGIAYLAILAQPIVFLFMLRALAFVIRADGLARSIVYLMIVGLLAVLSIIGAVVIVLLGIMGSASTISSGGPSSGVMAFVGAGCVAYCLGLGLGVTYFSWYIVTLFQLRGAIGEYLRRRG